MVIELGVMNNGYTDQSAYKGPDGIWLPIGSLADSHGNMQRQVLRQFEQGVLADKLGFDYFFLTEHHFQPEGAEFSPNPLMMEAAIAVSTSRIRLGQMANIAPWHHPLRLAEQAATLDILSKGRLEFGIGRGYQAREAEVLGRPYGAGIQDSEANRAMFEECYEIIIKCFTEESFSHHGEFFSIPPSYTNWHHPQTIAFYKQESVNRLEQAMSLGTPTGKPGVQGMTTMLKEISVGPQPLQKPHPQFWMPMTTRRSAEWAAAHGVNGIYAATPNALLKRELDIYYEAAEKAGWPDRLGDGRPFKRGWDSKRKRGVVANRIIHVEQGSVGNTKLFQQGSNMYMDYMLTFGSIGVQLQNAGFDQTNAASLVDSGLNLVGSKQQVIDGFAKLQEAGEMEDMMVIMIFDSHGLPEQMVEEQMRFFAEEITPVLHKEYGRPERDYPELTPPPEPVPSLWSESAVV